MRILPFLASVLALSTTACRSQSQVSEAQNLSFFQPVAASGPFVTYVVDHTIYKKKLGGAKPENVTKLLSRFGSGQEQSVSVSKNGAWWILESTRFTPCESWECLVLVRGDFKDAQTVRVDGEPVRAKGRAAINDDATLVVYPSEEGPHELDLYAIRRSEGGFGSPVLLTGDSSERFHTFPVFSRDGRRVLFDCGPDVYSQDGTNICEVDVFGHHFVKRVNANKKAARRGDFAPDGSLVFEAEWEGEQLWRLRDTKLAQIRKQDGNDNSPCVFADGRIASLWLGRPGGPGKHELKLTSADGKTAEVLLPNVDIADTGLSCSN
jgi:hypothetical protein